MDNDDEEEKGDDTSNTGSARSSARVMTNGSTSASTKQVTTSKRKISKAPPYLYTVMFNSSESLLMAGGAGRNEFRVFDWKTDEVVAMVNNIPKAILCSAIARDSDRFVFGCADSRIRMFDWTTRAKLE